MKLVLLSANANKFKKAFKTLFYDLSNLLLCAQTMPESFPLFVRKKEGKF